MTMESAPAPAAGQATAVQAHTVHPPRRSGGGAQVRPGGRRAVRCGRITPLLCVDALAPVAAVALAVPVAWPWPLVALQAVAQLLLFAHRGLYRRRLSPSVLSELPALLGLALLQWYVAMEVLNAWAPQQAIGWTVPPAEPVRRPRWAAPGVRRCTGPGGGPPSAARCPRWSWARARRPAR